MALSQEESRLLGGVSAKLDAHVDNFDKKYDEDKEFRRMMHESLTALSGKSDKAHDRIDKHEIRFGTFKYVAALIGTGVSAVYHFWFGGK
jgi:hypothetical protein